MKKYVPSILIWKLEIYDWEELDYPVQTMYFLFYVTQKRGKNKGRLAMVTHVWRSDIRISGYYDTRIAGVYLDLSEPNPDRIWSPWFFDFCDFECTHMALKRLSKEDLK